MLSALSSHLRSRRVILASQSPRRLELLKDCVRRSPHVHIARSHHPIASLTTRSRHLPLQGLTFEVIPSTFEENLPKERFPTPDLYVIENANQKALAVNNRVSMDSDKRPVVVIGCDTVVVQDGAILEKPKDEADAFSMLTKLSNRPHEVFSGVALFTAERGIDNPHLFFEKTSLVFGPLEPEDIRGAPGARHFNAFVE
jgi:predicted house-cleaning NTP pyrophosphatase (Maf/HAM1 superfamily)